MFVMAGLTMIFFYQQNPPRLGLLVSTADQGGASFFRNMLINRHVVDGKKRSER